jgi:hypothetical protein
VTGEGTGGGSLINLLLPQLVAWNAGIPVLDEAAAPEPNAATKA